MVDATMGSRAVRRLLLPFACLTMLAGSGSAEPTTAETLSAHYGISLVGLRIGDLYANGTLQPQAYKMDLTAHLTGIASWVSNVRMALASSGTFRKGSLAPNTYATSAASTSETRTLRMALNAGTVKAIQIEPPIEFHGERVPVSEANKRNVLDPTSALIMPVPMKEPLVGPAACDRTLPIFDGYARFDIALHYTGTQQVQIAGYNGPVAVCAARYRPISGHLVGSRATAFMAQNDGIEVWLAPIESAHVVVPLRVTMPTMTGTLDIVAEEFGVTATTPTTH